MRQKDVARAIGVDDMTIVNWERGGRMPRRYDKIRRLCETLDRAYLDLVEKFGSRQSEDAIGFGATIRAARIKIGLTQETTARLA